MPLSPITSYYLRRILNQNRHRLKFIVAPHAAVEAHPLADLNQVITSLYLDDGVISDMVNQLEHLVTLHKMLDEQGALYLEHQTQVEEEIL